MANRFRKTITPRHQYSNTDIRNFYLDLWNPVEVGRSSNDEQVTIRQKFHKRPDLFAQEYLGSQDLWWVLPLRNKNKLIDPIEDFTEGTEIFVPGQESLRDIRGRI